MKHKYTTKNKENLSSRAYRSDPLSMSLNSLSVIPVAAITRVRASHKASNTMLMVIVMMMVRTMRMMMMMAMMIRRKRSRRRRGKMDGMTTVMVVLMALHDLEFALNM